MYCKVAECARPVLAKGLCGLHYKRVRAGKDVHDHHYKLQQSIPRGGLATLGLHKHHPFYLAWVNMKTRCDNPKSTQWGWYGARGIAYEERWKAFLEFYKDMWEAWEEGLTLERGDNNLGYSKQNCCWATHAEQVKNRRPRAS